MRNGALGGSVRCWGDNGRLWLGAAKRIRATVTHGRFFLHAAASTCAPVGH